MTVVSVTALAFSPPIYNIVIMHAYHGRINNWLFLTLSLVLVDYLCIVLAYGLSLYIHFDCCTVNIPLNIQAAYKGSVFNHAWLSIAFCVAVGLYRFDWRNVGCGLIVRNSLVVVLPNALYWLVMLRVFGHMPVTYHSVGGLMQFSMLLCSRLGCKAVIIALQQKRRSIKCDNKSIA